MLKNANNAEVKEDRRSPPPLFLVKKVCFDSFSSTHTGQDVTQDEVQKKKSVTFKDEMLVEVFNFEDDEESRLGRRLYWEYMALDRVRFKDRIDRMEDLLSPVLETAHRNLIYRHRHRKEIEMTSEIKSYASLTEVTNVTMVVCNEK